MYPNSKVPVQNQVTGAQRNIQNFNKKAIYSKGFEFTTQAGQNQFNPSLGGKTRFLWGIVFYSETANQGDLDHLSLIINQEVIVDNVLQNAYTPNGAFGNIKFDQFYALPRTLSGSDSVQFNYQSINAHKINIIFYLSETPPAEI